MAEISFSNPLYLWYLIAVPLLIASHFYFLRYAKFRGMKFANFEALKRVTGKDVFTKNYLMLALRVVILTSLILAVSGATYWYKGQTNQNDFVLALDVSASMTAEDVSPTRINRSKEVVNRIIDRIEEQNLDSKVGLISFSGSAYIEQMPTKDFQQVRRSLNEIRVRQEGGTDIAGAVVTATNMLLGFNRSKSILLISDGSATVSPQKDRSMQNALDFAKQQKVIIHTLGVGTNTGPVGYLPEYYNATSVYKEETLLKLANSTQGTYNQINTNDQLESAFEQISGETEEAMISMDLSHILLSIALLLIFLEWGLVSTKFRRLP